MTILSYQSIKLFQPLSPIVERTEHESGLTYGLGPCSYDIRTRQGIEVRPEGCYLISSIEQFHLPNNICGMVLDKSTWARKFFVFQNTFIDPGFTADSLTLEATFHGTEEFTIPAGTPIAQIVFYFLDEETEKPYKGKYNNQGPDPQEAIFNLNTLKVLK